MKKLLILLLLSITASAQISLNPLQKYVKRVNYVFDTIQVDESHQILSVCGDSLLINLIDTAVLRVSNISGYNIEDGFYSIKLFFNGDLDVFFNYPVYTLYDTLEVSTTRMHPNHERYAFRTQRYSTVIIGYAKQSNQYYIFRKREDEL